MVVWRRNERRIDLCTYPMHMNTNIGTEEQWTPIFKRNPGLKDALNELIELTGESAATVPLESAAHRVIFTLRNVCMEECWEVLLLAANHYTSGAAKLIRALYERALTIVYLSQYPEKAQRFIDYAAIQNHRTLNPALKLYSEEDLNERIKPSSIADIKSEYERVKPAFQITKCSKCKTKQLAHGWDLDITSMAEKVQQGFPEMLLSAYTLPTLELHTTASGAFSRTSSDESRIVFDYGLPPESVDLYIILALQLMLIVHKVSAVFLLVPFGPRLLEFEAAFHSYARQHPSAQKK